MDEGVAACLLPRGSDCLRGAFMASDALMRVSVECSANDFSSCSECTFVSTVRCLRSVAKAKRSPKLLLHPRIEYASSSERTRLGLKRLKGFVKRWAAEATEILLRHWGSTCGVKSTQHLLFPQTA
jgi:hypothetical protein